MGKSYPFKKGDLATFTKESLFDHVGLIVMDIGPTWDRVAVEELGGACYVVRLCEITKAVMAFGGVVPLG